MARARAVWVWSLLMLGACTSATPGGTPGDGGASGVGGTGGGGGAGGSHQDGSVDARVGGDGGADRDARASGDAQVTDDSGAADGGIDFDASTVCSDSTKGYDRFDDTCSTAADCTLVQRTLSCCGTQAIAAVKPSEAAAYAEAAKLCDARFPACGCATGPTQADDLTMVDDTHPYAVASCTQSHCKTSFGTSTQKTACGPNGLSCDARTEVCVQREPVGPAIVWECKTIPVGCQERRDCNCVSAGLCTGGFNVCTDVGANTVDCMCPLCQ